MDVRVNHGEDEEEMLRWLNARLRRAGWVMEDHYDDAGVYQYSTWRPPTRKEEPRC
jgi:hypothetical protein